MGDCRIKIGIANSLLSSEDKDVSSPTQQKIAILTFVSWNSSDTTIREVLEENLIVWKLITQNNNNNNNNSPKKFCRLWDCTKYPPVDITSWPIIDFPDLQGPKSKTLFSAGWFPSSTILVIPHDMLPSQFSELPDYEDVQYNNRSAGAITTTATATSNVKLEFQDSILRQDATGGNKQLLPSHIMASVVHRFDDDDDTMQFTGTDAEVHARLLQQKHQNKREQRQKEKDRAVKLETQIARLEEQQEANERNKNVSEQVRRMLVKSRATGDRNLKMMDRLYFQCIVLRDDSDKAGKEYRYFSSQDSFAKIAGTFASKLDQNLRCEVLCRPTITSSNNTSVINADQEVPFRRFPIAMRVYEAISRGYLTESSQGVETLIIRFHSDWDDVTPDVLHDMKEKDAEDGARKDSEEEEVVSKPELCQNGPGQDNNPTTVKDALFEFEDSDLAAAIKTLDNIDDKRKQNTKKPSAATIKIKQMKMKSRAKGDSKRISRVEDRFFIELVVVSMKNDGVATSGYYFLGKTDPLERILQLCDVGDSKSKDAWEFLVPTDNKDRFCHVATTSMTTQVVEDEGILKSFGRLILRQRNR
jgi:hypothetical protein